VSAGPYLQAYPVTLSPALPARATEFGSKRVATRQVLREKASQRLAVTRRGWPGKSRRYGDARGAVRGARSVLVFAVGSADRSTGMAYGGPGHADPFNSGSTRAAGQADLRGHAVRLRNRRWCYCKRRSCEGYDEAGSSN